MQQFRTSLLLTSLSDDLIRFKLLPGSRAHSPPKYPLLLRTRASRNRISPSLSLSVGDSAQIINPDDLCVRGRSEVFYSETSGAPCRGGRTKGRFEICSGNSGRGRPHIPRVPFIATISFLLYRLAIGPVRVSNVNCNHVEFYFALPFASAVTTAYKNERHGEGTRALSLSRDSRFRYVDS